MNYSYGTNADQYLNKEGLDYLIKQLDLKYSGSGTVDLTNYYDKAEIDNLLSNIDTGSGTIGNDGVGIQSVELVNYELIVTLTDTTVINLGNVRGEKGLQGIQGLDGAKGTDGINGTNGKDGINGRGITSVVKTDTVGLVDTYTITYSDMTTSNFTVTNGKDGADGSGGSSGGGSSTDTYSTDEIAIGTWIDGKTIYRKIYDLGTLETSTTADYKASPVTYLGFTIGDLVDCRILLGHSSYGHRVFGYTNTNFIIPPPTTFADYIKDVNKGTVSCIINPANFRVWSGNSYGGYNCKVIMDYTKIE
jgi:hypothetical protein